MLPSPTDSSVPTCWQPRTNHAAPTDSSGFIRISTYHRSCTEKTSCQTAFLSTSALLPLSSRAKTITKYHSLYHRPLPRSNPDNPATGRADPLTHNFSILPTYPSLGGDATRKANNQQRHNPCPSLSAATDVTIQPQDHPQPEASARRLFHCSLPAQAHLHRSRQQEFLPVAESHRCRREESNCLTPRPDWHRHARHASQRLCGRPLARSRRCSQRSWGYVWNCALCRQCEGKGWTVRWRRVGQGVCCARKE